jgi:hypothetical protein
LGASRWIGQRSLGADVALLVDRVAEHVHDAAEGLLPTGTLIGAPVLVTRHRA